MSWTQKTGCLASLTQRCWTTNTIINTVSFLIYIYIYNLIFLFMKIISYDQLG